MGAELVPTPGSHARKAPAPGFVVCVAILKPFIVFEQGAYLHFALGPLQLCSQSCLAV